ncbi:unnamed protein product [Cuscuta epithymum]|nr:unnamed protein product [Cuscuta epithymum]
MEGSETPNTYALAHRALSSKRSLRRKSIHWWFNVQTWFMNTILWMFVALSTRCRRTQRIRYIIDNYSKREGFFKRLVHGPEANCISQLRMSRVAFLKLCDMLVTNGGLKPTKHMIVEEQVAIFLLVLSHHRKNRTLITEFQRSGRTISTCVAKVLHAVLQLHSILFAKPKAITMDCNDDRWGIFQNCVGALDGTYIDVHVSPKDHNRFRSRKGDIATNVLGVCNPQMQFIYVFPGWEGSAADGRVLRDALTRRFRVPQGCYYLVDGGYANCEGFLAPYRGQRYHLSEWQNNNNPHNVHEYFNMKHSQARNVIERGFGLLKNRWAILRSASWYPIRMSCRIIVACALLHNFIRREHDIDPMEDEEIEEDEDDDEEDEEENFGGVDLCPTEAWTAFREDLAPEMYNAWMA